MIPSPTIKKGVNVTGNSSSYFNGTVYVPNTPVTYAGNSSVGTPGCFQVIAYAVTFSGNTKLDNSKCSSDGATTLKVPSMCVWCNDEKARSARRRGAGILPCRRAFVHIDVRHLRSRTLCDHHAVIADARECWCSGSNDQLLTDAAIKKQLPTGCTGDPLPSDAAKQAVAPFLYSGGLTPTLTRWLREPLHLLLRHLNQVSPC